MENSFSSYRNDGPKSDSESDEIIDNSFVNNSFGLKNKLLLSAKKNRTVYIAPSDSDDSEDNSEDIKADSCKNVSRLTRGSSAFNSGVVESSEEEEVSPEIIPRRRPTRKSSDNRSSDSPLIRKVVRKRIVLTDSENDNSIILENEKHNKITCLKDTPLKLEEGLKKNVKAVKMIDDDDDDDDDSETGDDNNRRSADQAGGSDQASESEAVTSDEGPDEDEMVMSRATRMSIMGIVPKDLTSDESDFIQSDDSKSRDSLRGSTNSLNEPTNHKSPPKLSISIHSSPPKSPNIDIDDADDSRISCSTFGSPVHNESVDVDLTVDYEPKHQKNTVQNDLSKDKGQNDHSKNKVLNDLTNIKDQNDLSNNKGQNDLSNIKGQNDLPKAKVLNNLLNSSSEKTDDGKSSKYMIVYDDDLTMIINNEPEVIALSSDDDDDESKEKSPKIAKEKSPRTSTAKPKKSPSRSPSDKPKVSPTESYDLTGQGSMDQFLKPPSYPNQGMVFVKRSVKEKEMYKLNQLKEDIFNVRHLLENMDISTLPDGGAKLFERLEGLERQVRTQGDLVANMVSQEDEGPSDAVHPNGKPMTWEEIQKASNQVQPKMFGKQAMATHMAERSLILDRLRELHASLDSRPPETSKADPPRGLKTELMGHQSHALAWLKWRETQRPRGGILADDMGLGKTITMISLVLCDQESNIQDQDDDEDSGSGGEWNSKGRAKGARGGTLVVCPASLLQQWAEEVTKHCKSSTVSVTLHHGANRATQPHRLTSSDLVVTTYNILQRDSEKNGVLMKITWRRVILDEAHIVRNYKAATSVAVSKLKAVRRWALTGTPVQNKDLDVFALLKFLKCTPFDDLVMWKKWIDNKSLGGQERLNMIMSCILLRRTKQQLQAKGQLDCLPDRKLQEIEVKLNTQEMNVYQKVLVFSKTLFAQFLHQRADKQQEMGGFNAKNEAFDKMHRKMVALQGAKPVKSHQILVLLLRLRQICCHCGLIASMLDEDAGERDEDQGSVDLLNELNKLSIDDAGDKSRRRSKNRDDDDESNEQEESTTVAEAIRSVLSPNNPVFNLQMMSSKIQAVVDCLQDNVFSHPGDKAVVVSQWTSVLRLVEAQLKDARVRCVSLTGAVPVAARAQLVSNINDPHSSVKVMLLSLCAGGVGLNLCGANHLLLLDPHWNPQLEQQAQDRIYRVGQKKGVNIYKFICVETVEQSIRKLQEAKLDLADNILTGAKNTNNSKLTIEDLKTLFNM